MAKLLCRLTKCHAMPCLCYLMIFLVQSAPVLQNTFTPSHTGYKYRRITADAAATAAHFFACTFSAAEKAVGSTSLAFVSTRVRNTTNLVLLLSKCKVKCVKAL